MNKSNFTTLNRVIQSTFGNKQIFVTGRLRVSVAVLSVIILVSPSLPARMSLITAFFHTGGGGDYLPLEAHHQSSHLAVCLSISSPIAADEGNHETSISTIVLPFVRRITI